MVDDQTSGTWEVWQLVTGGTVVVRRYRPGMRGRSVNLWQGVAVAIVILSTVIAGAVRLGHDYPATWGTDFWQRVLVSILGTLGALLIGIALYYLKRRYDKLDADEEVRRTFQANMQQELVQLTRDGLRLPSTDAQKVASTGALTLTCAIYGAQFYQYGRLLDDAELKKLCKACHTTLFALTDSFTAAGASAAAAADYVGNFSGVFTQATMHLTNYLSDGTVMDLDKLAMLGEIQRPDASEEDAGPSSGA